MNYNEQWWSLELEGNLRVFCGILGAKGPLDRQNKLFT